MISPQLNCVFSGQDRPSVGKEKDMFRLNPGRPLALALIVALLLGCAHGAAADAPVRIMPLGASIVSGLFTGGIPTDELVAGFRQPLWLQLLDAGYDVDFVGSVSAGYEATPAFDPDNEGHPGWRDDETANSIYGWLQSTPADFILVHIGTNALDTSPLDVEFMLDEIDRYENDYGVEITVLLPRIINRIGHVCPNGSTTTTFNDNVEAMALDRITNPLNDAYPDKIDIVDMECGADLDYVQDQTSPYDHDMYDNLHPNKRGYAKMADLWYAHLTQLLPPPTDNCPIGMYSYWKLNEIDPPVAYHDFFGANSGVQPSGLVFPTPTAEGKIKGAQVFDGTGSGIDVAGDDFNWLQNDNFTIELWMKRVSPIGGGGETNNEVIVGRDDAASQLHWWLGIWNDGSARFQLGDKDGVSGGIDGPAIDDGSWHHLVGVRDGASGVNYFYVDGEPVGSEAPAYTAGFDSTAASLNIGWLNLAPYYHFEGSIDEFAVYNRSLTAEEIQQHYANGNLGRNYCTASGPRVTEGLLSLYRFAQGPDPSVVYDVSGVAPALDLTMADPGAVSWLAGGGIAVNSSTTIASSSAAAKIIDSCTASNEITIEAWVKPATVAQVGPARIVTLSDGPSSRNFTLGQDAAEYEVRLRTSTTTLNGIPFLNTTGGALGDRLQHVVYTRTVSGTRLIYVDGSPAANGSVTGTFDWGATFSFALANELTGDRPWLGEMHLVAIYDRALRAAEVMQNFNAGPHPAETVAGDFDGDGDVDASDLSVLILAYGSVSGDLNFKKQCDLNDDDAVDAADLDIFSGMYGTVPQDSPM